MPAKTRADYLQQYEYSDGSGNIVMVKAQAEPGPAKRCNEDGTIEEVDTGAAVRWIGNGRTILNNKGNPVKQYEPYFSVTLEYEDDPALVEVGITPILLYDAAGRNDCKLYPNHSYEKWSSIPGSKPAGMSTIPCLFKTMTAVKTLTPPMIRMSGITSPDWIWKNISRAGMGRASVALLDRDNRRAAKKTESHADTPARVYTDALGRTIYGLVDNGEFGRYRTRTVLDIEGNTLAVIDDRGNTVMAYADYGQDNYFGYHGYNMLPPPDKENPKPALYQNSMDGGEKWTLRQCIGQSIAQLGQPRSCV